MARFEVRVEIEFNGGGASETRYLEDVAARLVPSDFKITINDAFSEINSVIETGDFDGLIAWHPDAEWLIADTDEEFESEHGVDPADLELRASWSFTESSLRMIETD